MLSSVPLTEDTRKSVVLVGFESSGKSALFRGLTGQETGEEANFRGSTVVSRHAPLKELDTELVDLPGIRLRDDSETTKLALSRLEQADTVLLVVKGTQAGFELPLLLEALPLQGKRLGIVFTFADLAPPELTELPPYCWHFLGVPAELANTRSLGEGGRSPLLKLIGNARMLREGRMAGVMPAIRSVVPQRTPFEHKIWGRWLSLLALILLFAVPVYMAYLFSGWSQPLADRWIIGPLQPLFAKLPSVLNQLFMGDYGILSLGLYSFIWAFPVVLLIGISVALTEESGLKDRITDSLDGWLKHIGLSGRDLVPVLSGFGCNVVAVFQSRTCSACNRKSCVSLITFGSACSYQIGASLSIFGSAGRPGLFIPYLFLLFLVGAVHTRIWNGRAEQQPAQLYNNSSFLQRPSRRAVSWRVRAVVKQFLSQAMPIFLLICAAATVLNMLGFLQKLASLAAPALQAIGLPGAAAEGVLFSVLRKDGLLILNRDGGALLSSLSGGQVFLLVYLASTLTACLVTLWTVKKELGTVTALSLTGKQLTSSLVSTLVISLLLTVL